MIPDAVALTIVEGCEHVMASHEFLSPRWRFPSPARSLSSVLSDGETSGKDIGSSGEKSGDSWPARRRNNSCNIRSAVEFIQCYDVMNCLAYCSIEFFLKALQAMVK